jgi:hypothetical protein
VEPYADVISQYVGFGAQAASHSPCFEEWSRGVVDDAEVIAWLASLPPIKQQPNLVFAAARWHGVPAPGPYDGLRSALLADDGTIRSTILTRATQTNEVARLATLLPAFSVLAQGEPVALLEVGASAGLCLFPDRWGYEWHTDAATVELGPTPRIPCDVSGPAPLPSSLPEVAWRGGIDLNPLDVGDADAMAWLQVLVYPEHEDRRRRLAHAIAVARRDPPAIVRGSLLDELPALVEEAAQHAPVVVFHSAVIAYLDRPDRQRFQRMMTGLVATGACHWVSNEAPNVLPDVTATGPHPPPGATFVLGIDGRMVGWTHGHGRSLTWL